MYKTLLTIFIQLLLLSKVEGFGKRRSRKPKTNDDNSIDPSSEAQDEYVDPYCNCELACYGIVQKIPYLPVSSRSAPVDVQFSSACIRCGLCLAVAEQINQTLLDTHDMMSTDCCLDDDEADFLIKSVCDQAFRHYSLREIDGQRYICDRIPGATLVPTTADGLWEKKSLTMTIISYVSAVWASAVSPFESSLFYTSFQSLKNKCNAYLSEMGAVNVYRHWQKWNNCDDESPDLIAILCRGDHGIFRDCKHLPNIVRSEPKSASWFSKMSVMVEFKCN